MGETTMILYLSGKTKKIVGTTSRKLEEIEIDIKAKTRGQK